MITLRGKIIIAILACFATAMNLYCQRIIVDYFVGKNIILYNTSEYRLYFKEDVTAGLALPANSVIETGADTKINFRIEPEGTLVKLGENSTIKVVSLSGYEGSDRNEIKLISGVVRVTANVQGEGKPFAIQGQIADVSTLNGDFGMIVKKQAEESVVVLKGEVEYRGSKKGPITLSGGEMVNDFDSTFGKTTASTEYKNIVSNLDFPGISPQAATPGPEKVPEETAQPTPEPQTPEPTLAPTMEPTPEPAIVVVTPVPDPVSKTDTTGESKPAGNETTQKEGTVSGTSEGTVAGTEKSADAGNKGTGTEDIVTTNDDTSASEGKTDIVEVENTNETGNPTTQIIQQPAGSGDSFIGLEAGLGGMFPYFLKSSMPPEIKMVMDAFPLLYIILARGYLFGDVFIKPIPNLGIGIESGIAYITITSDGESFTFADIPVRGFVRFGNKALYVEAFGGYYFNIVALGFDTSGWEGGLRIAMGGAYIECAYAHGTSQYLRFAGGFAISFLPGQL